MTLDDLDDVGCLSTFLWAVFFAFVLLALAWLGAIAERHLLGW